MVQGSGIFVFKEKLKRLKAYLKVWNRDIFGDINKEWGNIHRRIQELDARVDESNLEEDGKEERRLLLVEQRRNRHKQETQLQQKVHQTWLK